MDGYYVLAIVLVVSAVTMLCGYALGVAAQIETSRRKERALQANAWSLGYTLGIRDMSRSIKSFGSDSPQVTTNPYVR